ncbi:hypothetical protein [Aestuariibaculum marinum]|uniref:Uncharacterized protein n=1 Tax=Aestuariibaculum marinum TaxID=2683592 RepID=A0A8J6Q203_9FLAO|nr:hypothetical protein [Aestuariibaculum marinum]MBD0823479.1 hypothetical protein [Aestuariibaculum marinum]
MILTSKTLCFYIATIISYGVFSQDKPEVNLGGALRFNYNLSSWKDGQKKRGGDFGYDFFRINTKAKYKGVKLNAEYRFYSKSFGGGMLKQGWIGYDFNAQNNLQMGLTQVPFGITQYNSHNWFFGINYYLGMEDDHDMGIKFSHKGVNWEYALAFFKNAEELNFGSNSDVSDSRYSYDVGSIDFDGDGNLDYRNKEVNQVNAKINYLFSGKTAKHKLGASTQYGGLYNLDTENMGSHYAIAMHYELFVGHFDVKAQLSRYKYNPENPLGEASNVIAMTAYGAPYLVASEGSTYTLGAAYNIPVKWHPVSSIQIYNDFGYINKNESDFENTLMNVTGALITAGNVYTYVDFAAGKNQPWLGPVWTDALAAGTANANWEIRFNINIGYYF